MTAAVPLSEAGAVVVAPHEIDLSNADELRERLLVTLDQEPAALLVDMSHTSFCDSSGLNALLWTRQRAEEVGARLCLVVTHRAVLKILRVTGLGAVFTVRSSVTEALREIPAGSG